MNRSNTIYYRFQSEKKKYTINFDTTEISIGDIKKEIIQRRNMDKVPEKFELLFFNENNEEFRDDNIKINPLQMLLIKRIPHYKLYSNFIETITDPNDISSSRFGEINFLQQKRERTQISNYDPIDKLIPKITCFELLKKKFTCGICCDSDYKYFVLSCCGESICEKCKNKIISMQENCKFCDEKTILFMENTRVNEFKERIINIIQRKQKENEQIKLTLANTLNTSSNKIQQGEDKLIDKNKLYPAEMNNYNSQMNQLPHVVSSNLAQQQYFMSNMNKLQDANLGQNSQNYNPHQIFFDNAKFFIIKSSNRENVDISIKNSEWATTQSNQKKLNEAFQSNYVILIFSVNKSANFQGYTIMTSHISEKVSNFWQNESSIKLGGSFSVQWLCQCDLHFANVKNINNPLNNHESVIKSRDTQELPKDIGMLLCNYCYDKEKNEVASKPGKHQITDEASILKIQEEIKKNREKFLLLKQGNQNKTSSINPQSTTQSQQISQMSNITNIPNMQNMVNMPNMLQNQTMFPMQNPLFYNFQNYQYFQMLQNQNKAAAFFTNNENMNNDNLNDKKSIKSIDKSRDGSMDKSVSTIKSRKSKNN